MSRPIKNIKPFDTQKSIRKSTERKTIAQVSSIVSGGKEIMWANKMDRVNIIRQGIPYGTIEVISKRLNKPVKALLSIVGLPQTTYNKKKSENSLLDSRDSELILMISELIDFGIEVFNNEEEKFQRWLRKPNLSLGGKPPENFLDTITGIDEVNSCLRRLEFGNLA